jgi:beta-1,2-mannobiose phosphorylase / 1,2-beta-oligomannan phosphorylase
MVAVIKPRFTRHGIILRPDAAPYEQLGVLNPACARLRDGTLHLYPRMVAAGNVSRIGSFSGRTGAHGDLIFEQRGFALEPKAPYELRDSPGGYGCEDPRVTFIGAIDTYVMAYIAFGPRGPEVALAISHDGLAWERLGLVCFQGGRERFADKDAAFFPEPVLSPTGVVSLAFYHRPTLDVSVHQGESAAAALKALPPEHREKIAVAFVSLEAVKDDLSALCTVTETYRLTLPPAQWGRIKVGAGTPPVRVREGWLAVIHGVDELERPDCGTLLRYSAGLILHDSENVERVLYRSETPLFVPKLPGELSGTVGHVVFPTGIDPLGDRSFDIYYGMADYEIGCGRLTF